MAAGGNAPQFFLRVYHEKNFASSKIFEQSREERENRIDLVGLRNYNLRGLINQTFEGF